MATPGSSRQGSRRILYLCPDYAEPSWGVGMLYTHVAILRRHAYEAWVLHHRAPFRPAWLVSEAPVAYLDRLELTPAREDLLVVPDVLAASEAALGFPGRRVVFVQGAFTIVPGLGGAADYRALGYERAIAVLPNVRDVVERHFGLRATVVPPCIGGEFYQDPGPPGGAPRGRRILLTAAKVESPDREVMTRLLARRLEIGDGWSAVELKGFSHAEVARLMRSSALLVNTNLGEAFNTTVPEAMAAGCIVACYEAFGGRDFLRDGVNAHVFPNHYVFPLVERVFDLMDRFEAGGAELAEMRRQAHATALKFSETNTERALLECIGELLA